MVLKLTVFPDNLRHNYRLMRQFRPKSEIAAVVKANAYGLGLANVVPALLSAGCRTFFVNRIDEGIAVRRLTADARIFVLDAFIGNDAPADYAARNLIPVFSTIEALARFPDEQNIAVRLDTGFNLAGIDAFDERAVLTALQGRKVAFLMSHLACAEQAENPKNKRQLELFSKYAALFPDAEKSLSASFGAALGEEYCFDVIRAGAALYGADVPPNAKATAKLTARVGWIKQYDAGESLGYNDEFVLSKPTLAATILAGSGDGIVHKEGCFVDFRGTLLPVLTAPATNYLPVDASAVAGKIKVGDEVDLFNENYTPDKLAVDAGMHVGADALIRLNIFQPYCQSDRFPVS